MTPRLSQIGADILKILLQLFFVVASQSCGEKEDAKDLVE